MRGFESRQASVAAYPPLGEHYHMAEGPTLASIDAGNESPQDTLRAVMTEMGGVTEAPASNTTATTADPTGADTRAETGDTPADKAAADRARDERGRFARAEQEAADKATADKGQKPDEVKAPDDKGADTDTGDDAEPPHDWPLARQTEFRKLPPALRTFVLDADKNGREVAAERGRYQAIESVMSPRRQSLAMQGITDDAAAIKAMFAYSDFIDQHPEQFIERLMKAKGLEFDTASAAPGGQLQPGSDDYDDPVIKNLQAEIARLNGVVNQVTSGLQGQAQAAQQHEISQARSTLESFRNEKDDRGRLKHPYMSEPRIRKAMSAMLRTQLASDHVQAYDMACRADPEVSAKIAAAADAARQREQDAERRKKAEAAQRAGSSITGTPAGPAKPELSGNSAREDLRAVAAEYGMFR